MNHRFYRASPVLSSAVLAAALTASVSAMAGSVSSRAQDPQLALAETGALAMAQRLQSQHPNQSPDAAASTPGTGAPDALNPYAVVAQASQQEKLKNGVSSALPAANANKPAECQVNFVPLPTASYNRGLYGAPAANAPTYVVAKGPVVVKC